MTKKTHETLEPHLIETLRTRLLDWFDLTKRDLPWRRMGHDPYAVWVSEIMLQQTQVATVKDYYTRWMAAFPDVESLARADLDEVLSLWAGLGYYRRARSLHEAANMVVEELDGELPGNVEGLKRLKGVGDYTAGAIASIAFGQVAPLVDGNVERVFARQFAIEGDPKERANQKRFWAIARELVDEHRPGDFNQALMELGAICCTPKRPTCLLCPIREQCQAFALGEPTAFPAKVKRKKAKPVEVESLVLIEASTSRYLLVKRPLGGLFPGLFEAPSTPHVARSTSPRDVDSARAKIAQTLTGLALPLSEDVLRDAESLGHVDHLLSHLALRLHVHRLHLGSFPSALIAAVEASDGVMQVVDAASLDEGGVALSAAQRKVFALARQEGQGVKL